MAQINVYDFTYDAWLRWAEENGEPAYRAAQIYEWLYQKRVTTFRDMSNLSNKIRSQLDDQFVFPRLSIIEQLDSPKTTKFLFKLDDGETIETVLMRHSYGNSICVSTQVGCKMGCTFCVSTVSGWRRNLTAGEMVQQFLLVDRFLNRQNERIGSIVIMGIGEPFDNFSETVDFIKIANSENGLNIGQRHITVSTCGIVPEIYRFADLQTQVVLAISLHVANNKLRSELMPINKKYPIEELMAAVTYYVKTTGRRVTFEYALIKGVNDSTEQANELAVLLKNVKAHVNLIPVNPVEGKNFTKSNSSQLYVFKDILEKNNITTTIRRELGKEIAAACGQLRVRDLS
jgi:23S rRNA (adenine2503-C2)-methyltransferase